MTVDAVASLLGTAPRKVLLYGDVNVNYRDGSAVWLQSMASCLSRTNSAVTVLLKSDAQDDRYLEPFTVLPNLKIARPNPDATEKSSFTGLSPRYAAQRITRLQESEAYDAVIVRGYDIASRLANSGKLTLKLWSYITDGPVYEEQQTDAAMDQLLRIAAESRRILVQTEEARATFESVVPSATGKTLLLHPMIPDLVETGPKDRAFKDLANNSSDGEAQRPFSLVYAGKFAKAWRTLDMTTLPERMAAVGIDVQVAMIGDKFQNDPQDKAWIDRMRILESDDLDPRVSWLGGLSREATAEEIRHHDVGLAWRDESLDSSHELSTKLLEYCAAGVPPVVNRTRAHEKFLGRDYPLFVDDDIVATISRAVVDPSLRHAASAKARSAIEPFTLSRSSERMERYFQRAEADYLTNPQTPAKRRVLLAGHDFKFAGELIELLRQRDDIELRIDKWHRLAVHNETESKRLLDWADTVICEWAGSNAVWYSTHKKPHQNLIVRFHGFEIRGAWLTKIDMNAVNAMVFVSDFYRNRVLFKTGWPAEKTCVIYNAIDADDMKRPKVDGAKYHVGIAGIVPMLKRPDRALDLIEGLVAADQRYYLHIRGRLPWQYVYEWNKLDQRDAYQQVFDRIAESEVLQEHVIFDAYGPDMGTWFRKIGWMLSPSTRETFHLAPVEGMASGSLPVIWEREGAAEIFGHQWIHRGTDAAVSYILAANGDLQRRAAAVESALAIAGNYDLEIARGHWLRLIAEPPSGLRLARQTTELPFPNALADDLASIKQALTDGSVLSVHQQPAGATIFDSVPEPAETLRMAQLRDRSELLNGEYILPLRSSGPVYEPAQGTVLYCVPDSIAFHDTVSSRRSQNIAIAALDQGLTVHLLACPGYPWNVPTEKLDSRQVRLSKVINGVNHVAIPVPDVLGLSSVQRLCVLADSYIREARRTRPEAIHATGSRDMALAALIASRRLGIPFVLEVRTEDDYRDSTSGMFGSLEKQLIGEADALIESAPGLIKSAATLLPDGDRVFAVPSPMRGIHASAVAAPDSGMRNKTTIAIFTNHDDDTSLSTLINAIDILSRQECHITFVVIGVGQHAAKFRNQVHRLNLQPVITFASQLTQRQENDLLSRSLFAVFPTSAAPCQTTAARAAFAAGIPALTSHQEARALGFSTNRKFCKIADFDNVDSVVDVLFNMLDNVEETPAAGDEAKEWVLHTCSTDQIATSLNTAYECAKQHYQSTSQLVRQRSLQSLRVGIIADTFTSKTLDRSLNLVELSRLDWETQISGLDAIFVESAWEGKDRQWFHGIAYHGTEEAADLRNIIDRAKSLNIPTIFWNKEDPVHFNSFRIPAAFFDHVFTTDANMIPSYFRSDGSVNSTVSSLPFFAEPAIHNPLPSDMVYEHSVSFAGTYYGDRYKKRSGELMRILNAAVPHGLTIYDRQHLIPDSAYQFPESMHPHLVAGVSYEDVLKVYKAHPVNINVNSVADSPTMFSRRVVEIAASGALVASGLGRGIRESIGDSIVETENRDRWAAILASWMNDEALRLTDVWEQLRAVYRSHLSRHALVLLFRTAGLAVSACSQPRYGLIVDEFNDGVAQQLARQTHQPAAVFYRRSTTSTRERIPAPRYQIRQGDEVELDLCRQIGLEWIGRYQGYVSPSHYEDLLIATNFGQWDALDSESPEPTEPGHPIFRHQHGSISVGGLGSVAALQPDVDVTAALASEFKCVGVWRFPANTQTAAGAD